MKPHIHFQRVANECPNSVNNGHNYFHCCAGRVLFDKNSWFLMARVCLSRAQRGSEWSSTERDRKCWVDLERACGTYASTPTNHKPGLAKASIPLAILNVGTPYKVAAVYDLSSECGVSQTVPHGL